MSCAIRVRTPTRILPLPKAQFLEAASWAEPWPCGSAAAVIGTGLLVSATCAQSKGATFALTNKKNRGVRPTNGGSDNVNERNTLNSPDGMDLKLL